jgi:PAS domain S-box-containing protein
MRHRDGHWVWVHTRGKVSDWTAEGEPLWVSGTHLDISEQKNAEIELAAQLRFVELLLDATPTAIYLKDLGGRYLRFNQAFEELFGIERAQWIGKNVFDLVPGEPAVLMDAMDQVLFRNRKLQTYEASFTNHKTGISRDGLYWKTVLTNSAGEVTALVGTILDVTERNRIQRELQAALQEARAATIAKSQFLANMSHEIRTPMNAILGMLKLLQYTELNQNQFDYVSKTEGAAQSLLGLLNDILDFSKIDAGKLELEARPFGLDRLLRDLSVIVSGNIGAKPVTVLFELDPAVPNVLIGDALRLQQVLINLSGNAIKFTAQGKIVIRILLLAQTDALCRLRFSVRDSGIGIAPENQKHIFDGFSQAEASTTRRYGGTGLGLSISKRLVALMGGELKLESVLGQGSTFYFELELVASTHATPDEQERLAAPLLTSLHVPLKPGAPVVRPAKPRRLEGLRLLVVEDNLVNQQVARELLKHEGAMVEIADNGELGVAAVASAAPQFDAVLMDLQMPVMDGYAASRAIRQKLGLTRLPIIAMTANAMASDREACLAAGMNEHVGKPFNLKHLVEVLQRLTRQ